MRPSRSSRASPEHSVFLGYLYAVTGRLDEAEALAAGFPPARQFWIYAGLGDKERTFDALHRALAINPRSWRVATWMIRPEMKFLRGDPRFQEIRRRLGLPEDQRVEVRPSYQSSRKPAARDARRDDDERPQEGRGLRDPDGSGPQFAPSAWPAIARTSSSLVRLSPPGCFDRV